MIIVVTILRLVEVLTILESALRVVVIVGVLLLLLLRLFLLRLTLSLSYDLSLIFGAIGEVMGVFLVRVTVVFLLLLDY